MHRTISRWSEFKKAWDGKLNFLMSGECVPFHFDMPALEDVIDQVRKDPDSRITPGIPGAKLNMESIANEFRSKPLKEVLNSRFTMAHFKFANLSKSGQLFHGFEAQVMEPWRKALAAAGFTWTRCYPILFISGPGCATNYHMDQSHVLAWQRYGTKTFHGLRDPERWAPLEERLKSAEFSNKQTTRHAALTETDALSYVMRPGAVLWNAFLTPHWVEASDGISYSINLSHGGLRLNGRLCPHEEELEAWRKEHAQAPVVAY